ncbi:UNVERIFIED_CONTAM: hypothetical protein HDU68_001849 [Siphonaria sp. JEL0065]|nr:hypothetical protein HDU68_001849 [Siphonaria sp. JEL0065]
MPQDSTTCFNAESDYLNAQFNEFFGTVDYCTQPVMNAMILYYNACSNKAESFFGFDSSSAYYSNPQEFQTFCLSKHGIGLNGAGLPVVVSKVSTTSPAKPTTSAPSGATSTGSSNGSGSGTSSSGSGGLSTTTIVGIGAGVLVIVALAVWWFCCQPMKNRMKKRHDPVQFVTQPGVNGAYQQQQQPQGYSSVQVVNEPVGPPPSSVYSSSYLQAAPLGHSSNRLSGMHEPPTSTYSQPATTSYSSPHRNSYVPPQQPAQPPPTSFSGYSSSASVSQPIPQPQTTYAEPVYPPTPSIYTQSSHSVSVSPPVNANAGQSYAQLSGPIRAPTPTETSFGTPLTEKERRAQEDAARAAREAENDVAPPEYQEFPDELRR